MRPISELSGTGALERISEELELDDEIMDFLDRSGLRPGARVEVVARTPDDVVTVRVDDQAQVGLSPFIAERVYVTG
jgi:hypothetical protein